MGTSKCKRCDCDLEWMDNKPYHQGIPHDNRKCKTVPGYIWCPKCYVKMLKFEPCEHYKEYGYKGENGENFFIKLISRDYKRGSSNNTKWKNMKKFKEKKTLNTIIE